MRDFLKQNGWAIARDLTGVAGVCLASYGAWLVLPAAGFMVAGALLIAGAWLAGRNAA